MTTYHHKALNDSEIDVLILLVKAQLSLGLSYIKNSYLPNLLFSLEYTRPANRVIAPPPASVGFHDFQLGNFNFSFFFKEGCKITAIKTLRSALAWGLKEAKDLSDKARPVGNGYSQLIIKGVTRDFFNQMGSNIRDRERNSVGYSAVEKPGNLYLTLDQDPI